MKTKELQHLNVFNGLQKEIGQFIYSVFWISYHRILETIMLALHNNTASPVKIRSLVPVEGNKSLLLICSPAELVGPISRLLSWCPLKPQHCMSYLGLISVCPPREGSMAAGPSPTLDRPLLGFPLPTLLACFTLNTFSLPLLSLSFTFSPLTPTLSCCQCQGISRF